MTQRLPRRTPGASPAEWAVAELDAVPTAVGHCYGCGFTTCTRGGSEHTPQPWTLGQWANFTAADIEWQTLRNLGVSSWSESQTAMIRALAGHLLADADFADQHR